MKANAQNLRNAEDQLGKWDFKRTKEDAGYTVPNFGVDSDVKTSLNNLSEQEGIHGVWNLPKSEWF